MNVFYKESKSNNNTNLAVGRGGRRVVARISDFFFFFQKHLGGEGKGGLASVSEFVLQRIQI